jgi:hypothetical protein
MNNNKPQFDLDQLIKNASAMNDAMIPHIMKQNKVKIWCDIFHDAFSVVIKSISLILGTIYIYKHIVKEDIIDKLFDFIIEQDDCAIMLILCTTLICMSFIKNKYKK